MQGASTSNYYVGGVYGYAHEGGYVYGVRGSAYDGSSKNYGLYGFSRGGSTASYGLYASTRNFAGGTAYGVYGYAYTGSGDNGEEYAGYFSGDLAYTGNLVSVSDRKFKQDIRGLGRGLSGEVAQRMRANAQEKAVSATGNSRVPGRSATHVKLLRLQPRTYQFRRSEYEGMGFPEGRQFGLVAQEVEEVFPELVSTETHPGREEVNDEGEVVEEGEPTTYKSVNYMQLIPIMIQTMREQQAEVDVLREEVEALKAALKQQGIQVR